MNQTRHDPGRARVTLSGIGYYTMTVTAKDTSGQSISVPTEVEGLVNSADLTKNPPVLSVAGQDFTLDKVKRVVRH
jgi:flagellar basal-body rod modification protein FlgD